jgi:SpoVK/Ycf46/Vps4 family AAA+-type ATPase
MIERIVLMEDDCCEGSTLVEISDSSVEREEQSYDISQWSSVDNKIISVNNTFPKLEPGYYSIRNSPTLGIHFIKDKISLNKLYRLPNEATDTILNDINKFWTLRETYDKYERVYKRNYLIYSAPGTGKTSLINIMCQDLIDKYNGIVFSIGSEYELELFIDAIKKVRTIEPDTKIITIIEDIDNFCAFKNGSLNTLLLNILDGNYKTDNLVIIATTNYIEKLEERYVNRPSRFDRVIEFPLPNDESRKIFIEKTVSPDDIGRINIDKWVKRTKGFSIDHINELILLYFVFGHDEEESFKTIENMIKNHTHLSNKTSVNKREIDFE